ncbi:MAG: hypothetical protein Q4E99_04845 [Bacillota bacterium]|nr:hypothetical protein [Bacillota bacterium]
MARKQLTANDINGMFIYHDPKKGCIFYDIFTKKGYILTNADAKTYSIYSLSVPIGIMAGYVLTLFNLPFYICAIVGVCVYLLLKVIFRFKFIYSLPEIENYQRPIKESLVSSLSKKYSSTRLIILALLLVAISIATMVNAKISNYTGIDFYLNVVLAVGIFVVAIITFVAFVKKIKK